MAEPASIQLGERNHRYASKATNNDHSHVQSLKPRVVKMLRRHRRRTHNPHHQHRTKTQTHRITSIHTTIRPIRDKIPSSDNQSSQLKYNSLSVSAILTSHHQQNEPKKSSVTVNRIRKVKILGYPSSITTIGSYENPLTQSSENAWYNDDSEMKIEEKKKSDFKQNRKIFSPDKRSEIKSFHVANLDEIKNRDGWPDWTSLDDKHRYAKKKNKNKYSRQCRIIFLIVGLLLIIATVILLAVLLTRPKTVTATTRNKQSTFSSPLTVYSVDTCIEKSLENHASKSFFTDKTAVLRWNSTGITVAGVKGQFGNASNQLNLPFGLTLDWSNTLYIADWSNHRVQKYLTGSSFGVTVAGQATGSWNSSSDSLHYPGDVAVDSNGNVYIADTFNSRIQLWASGSSTGSTVCGTGSPGNSSNELNIPYSLMRDSNSGTLYISDTFNNRIMSFPSGASSGSLVGGGNGWGTSNTQLYNPAGLHFDSPSNSLIIANWYANNVVRWIFGASSWTLIAGNTNGVIGNTSTELNAPMDVTLDPMGNIYVADRGNHRIQFYTADQANGITIAGISTISGDNSTMLNNPFSVALDSQLNLYVSDSFNSRVQKFVRY